MPFALLAFVFFVALDDGIGLRVFQSPLIVSTIVSMILGNVEVGLAFGSIAEILRWMLGQEGGMVGGFAAIMTIAIVQGNQDYYTLMIPMMITLLACNAVYEGVIGLMMPILRNKVEKKPESSLTSFVIVPMIVKALIVCGMAMYAYAHATSIANFVSIYTSYKAVFMIFVVLGYLLPFVGVSVVLRNLSLKDHYGAFFAGCATTVLVYNYTEIAGLVAGVFALGLIYLLYTQTKQNTIEVTEEKKGVSEKWW